MRLALVFAVVLGGCGTRSCKEHTAYVRVQLDSASAPADILDITLSLDGKPSQEFARQRTSQGSSETVEIDFDNGYPAGGQLDVTVTAIAGTTTIGTGHAQQALMAGCTPISLSVSGVGSDLSLVDDLASSDASLDANSADLASGGDLSEPDLSGCPYLYVSPSGNDANDGCKPDRSFATIKKAISQLGVSMGGQEIHVCKGTYTETSLLLSGVIKGGYDCTTWIRTASYGFPSFDAVNESIVQSDGASAVTGRVASNAAINTVIDGFTFKGITSGSTTATALLVEAAITVSNNHIIGGGATTTNIGSVGLDIEADADVFNNSIEGGSGTSTGPNGSVAVLRQNQGTPHLHDNLINGGTGTVSTNYTDVGALAILLKGGPTQMVGAKAIERNQINGGSGTNQTNGIAARAVELNTNISVDLIDNTVEGGSPNTQGRADGISSFGAGDVRVLRNRIFGGVGRGTQAINLNGNNSLLIENNMILAGTSVDGTDAEGIWVIQNDVRILNNTIVSGNSSGASMNGGIYLFHNMTGAIVENNLVASSGGNNSVAFVVDQCASQGVIKSLRNNVTSFNAVFQYGPSPSPGPCTGGATFTSDDAIKVEITSKCGAAAGAPCNTFNGGSGAAASGNLNLIGTTCGSDTGCVQLTGCNSAIECLRTLFGAWDGPSNGKSNLEGTGWQLQSVDPCMVTKGGLDLSASGVTDDLFQSARSAPFSIGAHEYDGVCCNNSSC